MTVLEINLCLPMTTAALPNGPKVAKAAKVSHPRFEVLRTWGELCERSSALPGDTPHQSPLDRLATRGNATRQGTPNNPAPPACPAADNGRGVVRSTELALRANSLRVTELSCHACQFGDTGLDAINRDR